MINVALIGCGYWGPNLLRNLLSLPGCNVKSICDLCNERLIHMKNLYNDLIITSDCSQIMDDDEIDAVIIATPVRTHFELAIQSLMKGKHTFIEKPLARSTEECNILIDEAKQRNLTLMVGHTFIYTPPVRKMKDIIESGEIGEVIYISSRRLNLGLFQKDINVAWDLAPHDLSIILYILGENPKTVSCQGKAHINPKIEDVTNITLTFNSRGYASIQSSWIDPRKVRDMTVVGTKKMIVYDDLEPLEKIKIYDRGVSVPPHSDTFAQFQYSYHYGDVYSPYVKQEEPLRIECNHFLDCIRSGKPSESSGEKGLEVVKILEAASKSLKNSNVSVSVNDSLELRAS
ncbi:MAG: Gfo/Idh/MocA family oxidoreductase [Spirochaetaceae bacterium]|nr:Gfo/Idh/MocA family oxidoreductase [Spirochaetaceae bacterium]